MSEVEASADLGKQLFSIQLMLAGIGFIAIDYVRVGIFEIWGAIGAVLLIVGFFWGAALTFTD